MAKPGVYALVRVDEDSYKLIRADHPRPAPIAFIVAMRDRLGNNLGWKLKPLLVMQGSKSRVWATAADALACTMLMTPGQARTAVKQADLAKPARVGGVP